MELMFRDDILKSVALSDSIFNKKFNEGLVHQITTAFLASRRQGSKAQKSRAQVSGSGKKPWRQKGTGRARAGSIRSPIWRSGGVTFASKPRDYSQKVNKKMYKGALKSIFSELIRQHRLIVFKNFSISLPKTKILLKKLIDFELEETLIIINNFDVNLFLASRNLHKIEIKTVRTINPVSLLTFKKIIITVDAIKELEEILK